jgi:hypothetical protein
MIYNPMKHLKNFFQIFENSTNRQIFTHEEIKSLPGYKELIDEYGFKDTSTPVISKSGNLRFEHPNLSNEYTIYSNGYIRQQSGPYPMWWNTQITKKGTPSVLVRPAGISPNDVIFGKEIESLEDYEIKFKYLKDYLMKKMGKSIGVSGKDMVNKSINDLSDIINKRIEKDPTSIPNAILKKLESSGKFIPNEFSHTVMNAGEFGFFD